MEMVGSKWRTLCGTFGCYTFGSMTLAGLAYFIRDWRHLTMATTVGGVFILLSWWWDEYTADTTLLLQAVNIYSSNLSNINHEFLPINNSFIKSRIISAATERWWPGSTYSESTYNIICRIEIKHLLHCWFPGSCPRVQGGWLRKDGYKRQNKSWSGQQSAMDVQHQIWVDFRPYTK